MSKYRVYPTIGAASAYALACYRRLVRDVAAGLPDQAMKDKSTGIRVYIPDVADGDISPERFPVPGRNKATGELMEDSGLTTAWAEPRRTDFGYYGVLSYDQEADPWAQDEPNWAS